MVESAAATLLRTHAVLLLLTAAQVQPDLATNGERQACYRGVPLQTAAGPCMVASVVGGSIK